MKKIITFLLLFSGFVMFAQQYTFNHLLHYSCKSKVKSGDIITYVNTNNPQYYLSVYNRYPVKKATLFDIKSRKAYNFDVEEYKLNDKIQFRFNYTSKYYIKVRKYKRVTLDFDKIDDNKLVVSAYEGGETLKKTYDVTTESSKVDLFTAFRFSAMHPYEWNSNLQISEKIKITDAIFTSNKEQVVYKLLSDQSVNLDIEIPK